jgi:diguanylate cyclase with GGDEF domain/PucR-like helix-turn-helix protein
MSGATLAARASIATRLSERREEIELAVLTRVYGVSDPGEAADLEYVEGLRAAVSAAIDYGLEGVEGGERHPPPVPAALLAQARIAARNGVSLDTVLRRYFGGYTLLGDFLIEEADGIGLQGAALKRLLRAEAALFDRLLTAVSEAHTDEAGHRPDTPEQRRIELIERLLAGEQLDTGELGYEFEAHHLAVTCAGRGGEEAIRELAKALDRRLLLVSREGRTVWAWLGGRRSLDPENLDRLLASTLPRQVSLALGEPGEGLAGWRFSHRQARAALPIALRVSEPFVRYADVALLASILRDDLLATSLHQIYLKPLEHERDGGETLKETLRAYFGTERNVSSAAAALGVSRQTVVNRLHATEKRFARPLSGCAAEVEAALALEGLGVSSPRATFTRG